VEVMKTERLLLRDLMEIDWQPVHCYASDEEVVRYMSWGPNTEEETKSFIQRALAGQNEKPRRDYTLAIVVKNENEFIGGCSICVSNPDNREGWIGYCLNRCFWGKGYATEAANALVDFGFNKLNLHRIFATCDPANAASAHVLEKIGMKLEGRMREHMLARGKWRDSLLYAVLDHERVHAQRSQR
jgi:ribosomal-protein-alanine N-acetyltransferase